MPVVTNSITIKKPLPEVFDYLDDPANAAKWFSGVSETVGVTRTEERVGDTSTVKYSVMGMHMDIAQTVTEWEKDARVTIKLGGMMPGTYTTTVSADGDNTTVTQTFDGPSDEILDDAAHAQQARLEILEVAVEMPRYHIVS